MTVKGKYGGRKVRDGTVVSDKMQKTVLVAVEEHVTHPLYKKRVRRMRRFMAHDEREDARLGDRVRILEAAPISRHKRWQLIAVLERVELPEVAAESIDLELLGEVKRDEGPAAELEATAPPVAQEASVESAQQVDEAAAEPEAVDEAEEVVVGEAAPEPGPQAAATEVEEKVEEPEGPEGAVPEAEEAVEQQESEAAASEEATEEPAPEEFDETPEASAEEIATAAGEEAGLEEEAESEEKSE